MAAAGQGDNDEPGPRQSVSEQIQDAKRKSDGDSVAMWKMLLGIFTGSVGATILLALLLLWPITELVIGAIYYSKCPCQKFIPLYLVVGGSAGILQILLSFSNGNPAIRLLNILLSLFTFSWFICGNVWVYGSLDKCDMVDAGASNYCQYTVFWFAFWAITAVYIFIGILILLILILLCVAIGMAGSQRRQPR